MPIHLVGATGAKHDWIDKRVSESDVHQPWLFQVNPQQHVIELRAEATIVAAHSGRKHLNAKAEGSQQFAEKPVQFIAEAATMTPHDLVIKQSKVKTDRRLQSNIEVFERDRKQMLPVQVAQHRGRGLTRPVVFNAAQILLDIHDYTGSSPCSQPASCNFGSAVRSSTRFSRISRLLGGLERNARSARATRRMALVSSRRDV